MVLEGQTDSSRITGMDALVTSAFVRGGAGRGGVGQGVFKVTVLTVQPRAASSHAQRSASCVEQGCAADLTSCPRVLL